MRLGALHLATALPLMQQGVFALNAVACTSSSDCYGLCLSSGRQPEIRTGLDSSALDDLGQLTQWDRNLESIAFQPAGRSFTCSSE